MGHGNAKKPATQVKKQSPSNGQGKQNQQGQGSVPKPGSQVPPTKVPKQGGPTTLPPPPRATPREKAIIWQDDNDIDLEDISFVVPIIISVIILLVFMLRKYIRWTVPCPSENRIDGKTVVITGMQTL